MPRPIWKGSIEFGLVSVPVELYSASQDHTMHFRQFERDTSDRIRYRRVNERTGEEVGSDDIVKGYDLGGGDYVLVEQEELDRAAPGRSRSIEIDTFVPVEQIDPLYVSQSYWLAPSDKDHSRAYGLLLRAMSEADRAGVASFVMRGREYLAAIRASEHLLMMDTLLFAEDVRDASEAVGTLPKLPKADRKELDMAVQLIESMDSSWDPNAYRDTYNERIRQLIEDKAAGRTVTPASEPREPTEAVDLMDALSASIDQDSRRRGSSGDSGGRSSSSSGRKSGDSTLR